MLEHSHNFFFHAGICNHSEERAVDIHKIHIRKLHSYILVQLCLIIQLCNYNWHGQLPLNFSSFSKFWALSRNNSPLSGLSGFSFISDVICWGEEKLYYLEGMICMTVKLQSIMNEPVMQQCMVRAVTLHLGYRTLSILEIKSKYV